MILSAKWEAGGPGRKVEEETRLLERNEQKRLLTELRTLLAHCQEKNWTVYVEWIRVALYQANLGLEPDNLEKIRPLMKSTLGEDPIEGDTRPKVRIPGKLDGHSEGCWTGRTTLVGLSCESR